MHFSYFITALANCKHEKIAIFPSLCYDKRGDDMEKRDNYQIQAQQAQAHFLRYDQQALIEKLRLPCDTDYLYPTMLCRRYRLCRKTGNLERWNGAWEDANTFGEVMTLLDLLCDSKPERSISGRWKQMRDFGLMFHRSLLEERDVWAQRFTADLPGLHRACMALNAQALSIGDAAYAIELFDGLCICLQVWCGDEEFPARLRLLWDENALQYIKYETMYFARDLLLQRIWQLMQTN